MTMTESSVTARESSSKLQQARDNVATLVNYQLVRTSKGFRCIVAHIREYPRLARQMILRMETERASRKFQQVRDDFTALLNQHHANTSNCFRRTKALIRKHPQLARMELFQKSNGERCFPLMALATKRFGSTWTEHMQLLTIVYEAFPDAVETRDTDGRFPLHTACDRNMHQAVVLFLLERFPRAATVSDYHNSAWPSLNNYFQYLSFYEATVKNLVRAFSELDKLDRIPPECRDDCVNWSIDLPPPLLVAIGIQTRRPLLLRQIVLNHPRDTRVLLGYGNTSDLALCSIKANVAELLARRVAPWVGELWLDTRFMFTADGLSTFLSTLASSMPTSLSSIRLTISVGEFGTSSVSILAGLSSLLRQSPNLTSVTVEHIPTNDSGAMLDDVLLSAVAKGLGEDHPIEELNIHGIRGPSLVGIDMILSTCCSLRSICLLLDSFTEQGAMSLAQGIRSSRSLTKVVLRFAGDSLSSSANHVIEAAAACSSIEDLVLSGTSANGTEVSLPALASLAHLKSLVISIEGANRQHELSCSSNALVDLIDSSNNLVDLEVFEGQVHLPANCLCELLKRNTVLETIKLYSCHDSVGLVGSIIEALRDSNTTLRCIEIRGRDEDDRIPASLQAELSYYLKLNRAGRVHVMRAETATTSDVVQVVEGVLKNECNDEGTATSLCYGLLRASPHLWSAEFTARIPVEGNVHDDEDSL